MSGRRGFTLAELLVVVVLAAILLLATYQVLVTSQKTYTTEQAQISSQQTVRAGLDVLFGELREISASGGDIITMSSDGMRVRAMRTMGLVCGVDYGPPGRLTVRRVGNWFDAADSVVVFADQDIQKVSDDVWHMGKPSAVDTTALCGSAPAQVLTVGGMTADLASDTVRMGAPVRAFRVYDFGLNLYSGEYYLTRAVPGGAIEPLVGPLRKGDGLEFRYLDQWGNTTALPTSVAQIEVTLRTRSFVTDARGYAVSDSVTARIYARN